MPTPAVLPDKPVYQSWAARGAALFAVASIAESFGVLPPGSVAATAYALQDVDWDAIFGAAQGLGIGAIVIGFRRIAGQILTALKQPAI